LDDENTQQVTTGVFERSKTAQANGTHKSARRFENGSN
jgi:hypothetical protein